jgi:thymidylate synthase ThyX
VDYPVEIFTKSERDRLASHFSNLDRPVYSLRNLPETTKAALFARYSRYPGTLRRLFLDEFADTLPAVRTGVDDAEGARAARLFERIFVGYGDDSVAQLGGIHVACEWTSNVLTKILQRPRLAAYLEQSTRYIAYDRPMPDGRFRHFSDEQFGPAYDEAMTLLFATYRDLLAEMTAWFEERYPPTDGDPPEAHGRAVRAKALDTVRGLLPAAALSHMGIYASGQSYEQLILHLLAHPLPEAQQYGAWILEAVEAVTPSFVARIPQPNRGGAWIDYLRARRDAAERVSERLELGEVGDAGPAVRLLDVSGDEEDLLAAVLFEVCEVSEATIHAAVARLDPSDRARVLTDSLPLRVNRRHRPNRGFERLRYRFEIVSDYGAFRDLQRHRMLTVQWQRFTPWLGADVPEEVEEAGHGDAYRRALDASRAAYEAVLQGGASDEAAYALCLAFRIRYVLDLDAREAMHVIELRSGEQGHPSYRAVAREMHRLIGEVHPAVAAAMDHVNLSTEPRLERLLAEIRNAGRR